MKIVDSVNESKSLNDDFDIEMENVEELDISKVYFGVDKTTSKKKVKKLPFIIAGGILGALVLAFLGSYYYVNNTVKGWENYIYPGVSINGKEVSNITKDELANILKEEYLDPVMQKNIVIKASDNDYTLSFSEFNPQYNIDEVVEEAFDFKKDDTLINKYLQVTDLLSSQETKELTLQYDYDFDDSAIMPLVDKIDSEVFREPENATFKLENGNPVVTDDIKGLTLNKESLISSLKEIASDPNSTNLNIEAPLNTHEAAVTGDTLKRINGVISTFTTSDDNHVRLVNMGVAARDLNGTLLMPGETFSFNDTVGDSTPEKGYLQSYSFIDNKSVLDYGGGVCQVSTTLYGTLLRANIIPTERGPHMKTIWYVPIGLDAAIFYGVMDLKFVNTYDAPIYIQSFLDGQNLTITFYGDVSLKNGLTYEPYSVPISGLVADSYLNTIDGSGNVIETNYLFRDTYNP